MSRKCRDPQVGGGLEKGGKKVSLGKGLAGTGKNVAAVIPHNEPDLARSPHPSTRQAATSLLHTRPPTLLAQTALALPLAEVPRAGRG